MKWMIVGLVWSICWSCFSDEECHIFTDQKGRVIEAKIIQVNPNSGKVTIKRNNCRNVTVPISVFSKPDQDYIKNWLSAQDFLSNSKLKISITKKKGTAKRDASKTQKLKTSFYYEVKFLPAKGVTFDSIRMEYCIYINSVSSKDDDRMLIWGGRSNTIQLTAQKLYIEKTREVRLYRYFTVQTDVSDANRYGTTTTDTSYNKTSESKFKGIRVRVYFKSENGQEFMREICAPTSLGKKYEWKEMSDEAVYIPK